VDIHIQSNPVQRSPKGKKSNWIWIFHNSLPRLSASGRVINPYRSQLDPEMVEALVCTRDWIVGAKKGESFSLIFVLVIILLRSYYLSIH
jgi:hypothetical protein